MSGSVAFAGAVDPMAALLLCTPGPVDLSVINGVQVIREGALLTCDLQVGVLGLGIGGWEEKKSRWANVSRERANALQPSRNSLCFSWYCCRS